MVYIHARRGIFPPNPCYIAFDFYILFNYQSSLASKAVVSNLASLVDVAYYLANLVAYSG